MFKVLSYLLTIYGIKEANQKWEVKNIVQSLKNWISVRQKIVDIMGSPKKSIIRCSTYLFLYLAWLGYVMLIICSLRWKLLPLALHHLILKRLPNVKNLSKYFTSLRVSISIKSQVRNYLSIFSLYSKILFWFYSAIFLCFDS